MNSFCTAPEMDEVHAELLMRVSSSLCVCGAAKGQTGMFCPNCWKRLRPILGPHCSNIEFYLFGLSSYRRRGLWLYDLCCDLLHDPNARLTKRTPKENHHGR